MSGREMRELCVACPCHALLRLALGTARFRTFVLLSRRRLPRSRNPLAFSRLRQIAAVSRRVCRGSCLSESVVLQMLAERHGHGRVPVTIGVSLAGGVLRAHAWAGDKTGTGDFAPLWSETRRSAFGAR